MKAKDKSVRIARQGHNSNRSSSRNGTISSTGDSGRTHDGETVSLSARDLHDTQTTQCRHGPRREQHACVLGGERRRRKGPLAAAPQPQRLPGLCAHTTQLARSENTHHHRKRQRGTDTEGQRDSETHRDTHREREMQRTVCVAQDCAVALARDLNQLPCVHNRAVPAAPPPPRSLPTLAENAVRTLSERPMETEHSIGAQPDSRGHR